MALSLILPEFCLILFMGEVRSTIFTKWIKVLHFPTIKLTQNFCYIVCFLNQFVIDLHE